jgi:hypothetical protein
VLWLLFFGCVHPGELVAPELTVPVPARAPVLAGAVREGRFIDATWGYSVPIPSGWSVHPAEVDDSVRVVMVNPDEQVRLRVAVISATDAGPDCDLTFTDDLGHDFGALRDVRISTCGASGREGGAASSRILTWSAGAGTPPIRVEAEVAPGYLGVAEDAAALVLRGYGRVAASDRLLP